MRIRRLMPFTGKSQDPDTCRLFIANIYFLVCGLKTSVFYNFKLGIMIYNAQSSMSSLQAFQEYV